MKLSTPIDPRQLMFWVPAAALMCLLLLLLALARWSGDMERVTSTLQRQLHAVYADKEILLGIQAARNAQLSKTQQPQQGLGYATLENALRDSGLGEYVRHLRPEIRSGNQDVYVEERLQLRLSGLDSAQMLRFFYDIDNILPPMTVESLNMRKNSDGFLEIDAILLTRSAK